MIEEENEETMSERWERVGGEEYLDFDKIPDSEKLHPSRTFCALLKIASLMKDSSRFDYEANHDIIWLPSEDEYNHPLTDEEILYLVRCGIHWDDENDCPADFC